MQQKRNITNSSDLKRTEAFNKLADTHKKHKSIIQAALSNVDSSRKNKIKFDDNDGNDDSIGRLKKKKLLESDEESDIEFDFSVKKQFEGKTGQKLLELKTRYHNDSRFVLDERFVDDKEGKDVANGQKANKEDDVVVEKRQQLRILEEILGKKRPEGRNKDANKQSMIRFDPSLPEHSKFVVKSDHSQKKPKKKRNKESVQETEKNDDNQPVVSKEIFYKVDDSLKNVFNGEKSFSLLGAFGQVNENEDEPNDNFENYHVELKQNNTALGSNPFRYDSSSDESDIEATKIENKKKVQPVPRMWNEPFFFEEDDYRFQDAQDFMKRIVSQERGDFREQRNQVKFVAQRKILHNQKRNSVFQNKLGRNNKIGKHKKFGSRKGNKIGNKFKKNVKK